MNGADFHQSLRHAGYEYFVGVPDSVLSDWIDYAANHESAQAFQIAGQEGEALSLAIGYHLATQKTAVVFLQNSGLGNLINPLMSMAHFDVYRIPILFIIGWRGALGISDEPQHQTMGQATRSILHSCQVPSTVIRNTTDLQKHLAADLPLQSAILIEPGSLSCKKTPPKAEGPQRIHYLKSVLQLAPPHTVFFSTTGFTSRELWALQSEKPTHPSFYSVGGMGFLSAIGLGFAQFQQDRHTCILDGDGAFLMHLGNVASIGARRPSRFLHILFRNNAHESTGSQALAASPLSWAELAKTLGYKSALVTKTLDEFCRELPMLFHQEGPTLLEVHIPIGTLETLPRPRGTPRDWLQEFRRQLS